MGSSPAGGFGAIGLAPSGIVAPGLPDGGPPGLTGEIGIEEAGGIVSEGEGGVGAPELVGCGPPSGIAPYDPGSGLLDCEFGNAFGSTPLLNGNGFTTAPGTSGVERLAPSHTGVPCEVLSIETTLPGE